MTPASGPGSGYAEAGAVISAVRVTIHSPAVLPPIAKAEHASAAPARVDHRPRPVYWRELGERTETPVYWGPRPRRRGAIVGGPAIVEYPHTTIAARPGQSVAHRRLRQHRAAPGGIMTTTGRDGDNKGSRIGGSHSRSERGAGDAAAGTEQPSLANERTRRRHSFKHGYIPPKDLVIRSLGADSTSKTAPHLDVITEEVIRSKLWNLNSDHGDTIRRVSGSNIVVEGSDFNCSITNELGDAVTFSTYLDVLRRIRRRSHQVDARTPLDERRHPRRRRVLAGRPVGRLEPPDGHRGIRSDVRRRQVLCLDVQLHPPTRGRRRDSPGAWCKTRSTSTPKPRSCRRSSSSRTA